MGNHKSSGSKNIDNTLDESLWNNSFVTAIAEPVFHQAFLNKNILKVSGLLIESGSFLTWQIAKQKYNLNDGHFIDWLGIINSIPSDRKSQISYIFRIIIVSIKQQHNIVCFQIYQLKLLTIP